MTDAAVRIIALAGFVLTLAAAGAKADTDYRCLNNCVGDGQAAALCMPSCTFTPTKSGNGVFTNDQPNIITNAPSAIGTSKAVNLTPHHVLSPLRPLDDQVLLKPTPPPALIVHQNYQCIAQCLQGKMQYQLCEEGCATVTKANGDILKSPAINGGTVAVPTLTPTKSAANRAN